MKEVILSENDLSKMKVKLYVDGSLRLVFEVEGEPVAKEWFLNPSESRKLKESL